jgi:hypothetical protein
MNWRKYFRRSVKDNNDPLIITFTGGMGAQMISAAIYFSIKNSGQSVFADLSYFDKAERLATVGNAGDCSHWAWQLAPFRLRLDSFQGISGPSIGRRNILHDGSRKLELGLRALEQVDVRKYFEIDEGVNDILPAEFSEGFLCIHIRRGDYVNVASYLISDRDFVGIAERFSGLVRKVVVLSDSLINDELRNAISSFFSIAEFLDNVDAYSAHCVMRNAKILVCSNSQFSLIAAVLNTKALIVIPRQWFDGNR